MTMQLIETKTLGTAAASIEFTSIPQDFTDLVLLVSARSSRSAIVDNMNIQFNNVTTAYTARRLYGTGASAVSGTETSIFFDAPAATSTASTFGNALIYIPNYTGSTNKSVSLDHVTEQNATTSYQTIMAGLWSNTAAITSIKLLSLTSSNYVADTVASLYGVLKGSGGATVS
jgi:hypothetical protein